VPDFSGPDAVRTLPLTGAVDPVPDPSALDALPGPLAGELLGGPAGWDEAADDDGLGSVVGDGFAAADRVPLGLAMDELAQLVGFGLAVRVLVVLAVADAEAEAELVDEALAVVSVAVELALALLLAGGCGLVLGLTLGLTLPADGVVEGLPSGVVDGVLDWAGRVVLPVVGVPDAAALTEGQDAAGAGVRCPGALLVMPTAPPLGWPGPDPGALAELVVPEPVTVAVRVPIACRNGGTANATAMPTAAQATPRRGRSSPSRQSRL
jgi:hypothetical protein